MDEEKLSLLNLKGGAAVEMFDLALDRVLANIADVNTDLKPRKITLSVTISPNKDRSIIGIAIGCDPTLRNQERQETYAHIKSDPRRGVVWALEHKPEQQQLFGSPALVVPMSQQQKGGIE